MDTPAAVPAAIKRFIESTDTSLKELIDEDLNLEFPDEEGEAAVEEAVSEADDAPVVKFIQKMLVDAINEGASDIHFEPYEKNYRVRFRVDGELREVSQPPLLLKEKIASRIKVISRLDISEKLLPARAATSVSCTTSSASAGSRNCSFATRSR